MVQHIAVDISFNQMAGLCSLCFLEQVDQLIGKDHLFKRSIILVKAWCHYESRILGAYYGLISTYALETMILYIISLFHSSLHGPLSVLYKFLDYYSTFDWDKYCISLKGPVAINTLPEIVVETSGNNGSDLLLSKEFIESFTEYFSAAMRPFESKGRAFVPKHLNVMDPLKDNNNLGRSITKGNSYRIRSALSYGAAKLKEVLMQPGGSMVEGLKKYFINTLNKNGKGQGLEGEAPVPAFGAGRFEVSNLSGDYVSHFKGLRYGEWFHNYTLPIPVQSSPPTSLSLVHNKNAPMGFNRNVFSLRNTNEFVPRHYHSASRLISHGVVKKTAISQGTGTYDPAVSAEKKLNRQGTGTYTIDIGVEKKLKLQGTGTFIPNLRFKGKSYVHDTVLEEKLKLEEIGISGPDISIEEKLKSQGTVCYFSDMGVEGNFIAGETNNCIPEIVMEENATSRGLGKCILDSSVEEKEKPQGAVTSSLQVEVSSVSYTNESSSCLDLPFEEFPLLPNSKTTIPSENHQSVQPTAESSAASKSSPCLESIEFGTLGPSSPVESKDPDHDVSATADSVVGVLRVAAQEPSNLSEPDKESVPVHPYQLEDEDDFPPLQLQSARRRKRYS